METAKTIKGALQEADNTEEDAKKEFNGFNFFSQG